MVAPETQFSYNDRLGIPLPNLTEEWESFTKEDRSAILLYWEQARGKIPDRIMQLEREIVAKQNALNEEEHFGKSCRLNSDIAELASRINDLHIWFRLNQHVETTVIHG